MELRTALDVELFAQGARALAQARDTRPKNTNKAYDPKQKEWQEFCAEKGFEDGELVYENKVIWFLNDRVLDREIRGSRYKRESRTTVNSEPVQQTLGISAVKGYIAAIVDLWSFQKSKGMNVYPTPHGEGLNGLLRAQSRTTAKFPDFFTVPLLDEGPTPCYPMIIIIDNGKTNSLGRLEYGAVIRHQYPLLYTMAHVAFYLFYR
ncbi:hypothetical protein K469DRAFT_591049 [Zopfia rhizophila CBS 207.26]|uniref:Ndc10 domain-containing protein n=1 Tax=Zopfia rhizophila CBS 207.26 TaxID=1314779 RepID=A0A6A6DPQ9_9PEZI|nr:hypothetical protein K469DRAFT_591049 [Zopfia rhizophila CBS 207.26]